MYKLRGYALLTVLALAGTGNAPLRGGEVDRCLPDDSEIYVSINVRQLLDSPIVRKHALAKMREALHSQADVEEVLKELGFDPFKDLDRIVIGSPTGADKDRGLFIAHGRFDLARFKAKGDEAAEQHGDNLKILQVPDGKGGKERVYEVNAPQMETPLFVALPTETTLLVSPGKDYIVDALKKLRGGRPAALKNRDFQGLLEQMDARQSLGIAAVSSALQKGLSQAGGDLGKQGQQARGALDQFKAIGGGLTLGDDFKLEVVLTTRTERQAQELLDMVKQLKNLAATTLGMLANQQENPVMELGQEIINSLRVSSKGASVIIKGRVSSDTLEDTFKKSSGESK